MPQVFQNDSVKSLLGSGEMTTLYKNKNYMRKIAGLITLLMVCAPLFAQENYTKIYDDPEDVLKGHVALEYYGVDVGFSNISGAMIFIMGVNGAYTLSEKLHVEASARLPLLRFEKQGTAFVFDGGAAFALNTSTTDKPVRVILGYKEEDNFASDTRTTTTKYVNITGSVKKSLLIRGGVYLKNTTLEFSEGTTSYVPTNLFHKGVYIGICKQRQYYFQLERNINGRKANFGAGSIFKPYFDIMVLPTVAEVQVETLGFGVGDKKELSGFIGARAGFRWYRNPFKRKQNGDHRIPFFGNSVVTLEAGMRPVDGLFINGGISYILKKF